MPKKKIYDFEGSKIIVRWDRVRCIHAEKCVHGLPQVFDPARRPWIEPDQVDVDEVSAVVLDCPTGALHFERKDGDATEPVPTSNVAWVAADGPLYVHGDLVLDFADGSQLTENRVALCRCGESKNKPFCDNSHLEAGFKDDGSLGAQMMAPAGDDESQEPLALSTAPNGPLLFRGPIEMSSADGSNQQKGAKGALCRCGASQNKPFCDGSHSSAGFEAE